MKTKQRSINFRGNYITHALGAIDGVAYTNSLDAFLDNYRQGCRVFEVDFDLVDDHLICCHDETMFKRFVGNQDYTYENFMRSKLLGKYTTLDIQGVSQLLRDYQDIWIITDTKYSDPESVQKIFSMIKTACAGNLNRIIPQIYNQAMYQLVTAVDAFAGMIFTLYQLENWDAQTIADFCVANDIPMVTMWHYLLNPKVAQIFHDHQIKIGTHTVNDATVAGNLRQMGCDYFYTDNLK